MKKSVAASPRGSSSSTPDQLKAAIDRGDINHHWAVRALRRLVARMDVVGCGAERMAAVFDEIRTTGAAHGLCRSCAVVLARSSPRAFVLTTDFRDFAAYRVPFASPEGAFHM